MIEGRSGKRGGHKLARVFRATQSVSMFLIYLVWGLIILGEEDRSCVYSPPPLFFLGVPDLYRGDKLSWE